MNLVSHKKNAAMGIALALAFAPAAKATTYIYNLTATGGGTTPDPAMAVIKATIDSSSTIGYAINPNDLQLISTNLSGTTVVGQFYGTAAQNTLQLDVGSDAFFIQGAGTNNPTFLEGRVGGGDTLDGTVTQTAVSAAPEPAAWLLMLGGVGMAGAALRITRRAKDSESREPITPAKAGIQLFYP